MGCLKPMSSLGPVLGSLPGTAGLAPYQSLPPSARLLTAFEEGFPMSAITDTQPPQGE